METIFEFFKQQRRWDNLSSACKDCTKKIVLNWRKNNKVRYRKQTQKGWEKWKQNNPDKAKATYKKWYYSHLDKVREFYRQKSRRNRNTLKGRLHSNITRHINHCLKKGTKNKRSWEKLLGYTLVDLIKRLKLTMPKGFKWEDYISGKLQIDHIIPIYAFNFSRLEHIDFKRCWALSNLRLLPKVENLKKGNRLNKPFQPSLKLENTK